MATVVRHLRVVPVAHDSPYNATILKAVAQCTIVSEPSSSPATTDEKIDVSTGSYVRVRRGEQHVTDEETGVFVVFGQENDASDNDGESADREDVANDDGDHVETTKKTKKTKSKDKPKKKNKVQEAARNRRASIEATGTATMYEFEIGEFQRIVTQSVTSATKKHNAAARVDLLLPPTLRHATSSNADDWLYAFIDKTSIESFVRLLPPVPAVQQHEFSARLEERNLAWRFELAFACLSAAMSLSTSSQTTMTMLIDFAHLFALASMHLATRGNNVAAVSNETSAFIARLVERQAFGGRDARSIESLLQHVTRRDDGGRTAAIERLFGELHFADVIERFQAPHERWNDTLLTPCVRVDEREFAAFLDEHRLDFFAHVKRTSPQIADVIWRFEDRDGSVTPQRVAASLLLQVPTARGGVDYLIVCTPATKARFYVAMRGTVAERIVLGVVPRAIVEHRAQGNIVAGAPLMAPVLAHVLTHCNDDEFRDSGVLVDAICAVQSLTSARVQSDTRLWTPSADVRAALVAAKMLNAIADMFARRAATQHRLFVARELVAPMSLKRTTSARTTPVCTVYAALQTALTRDDARHFCFMDVDVARTHTAPSTDDGPHRAPFLDEQSSSWRLAAFIENQWRTLSSAPERLIALADTRANEHRACWCSMSVDECTTLQRLTARTRGFDAPFQCCVCARHSMHGVVVGNGDGGELSRGKRRRRGNGALCEACSARCVVSTRATPRDFVPLYDPQSTMRSANGSDTSVDDDIINAPVLPTTFDFVMHFAAANNNDSLYALRTGPKHNEVFDAPQPRMSAEQNDRADVALVVEATRQLAQEATSTTTTTSSSSNLLVLLETLEMLSLRHCKTLVSVWQNGEHEQLLSSVTALTDEQLNAVATHSAIEPRIGESILFPMCRSPPIAESSRASLAKHAATLSRSLLFAGRLPRPLAGFPVEFLNALFLNVYLYK